MTAISEKGREHARGSVDGRGNNIEVLSHKGEKLYRDASMNVGQEAGQGSFI